MEITVLQWNVWYKENIERVLDTLKANPADLICLQELTRGYIEQTRENTWEFIAHELNLNYKAQEFPIVVDEDQWAQANVIFTKFDIKNTKSIWLHEPRKPDVPHDQYRGYLEVKLDTPKKNLTVATSHMSFQTRLAEDPELEKLTALLKNRNKNYILAADINATPDSPRIAGIEHYLRHAGPAYTMNTWPTKPVNYGNFAASTPVRRVDYIFTSNDLKVSSAEILKTEVSDHLPILAKIIL